QRCLTLNLIRCLVSDLSISIYSAGARALQQYTDSLSFISSPLLGTRRKFCGFVSVSIDANRATTRLVYAEIGRCAAWRSLTAAVGAGRPALYEFLSIGRISELGWLPARLPILTC